MANTKKQQLPTKDKPTNTELSWQKWKFQRNIKKLLDRSQTEELDGSHAGQEIGNIINNRTLSQNFEGVSEVVLVMEMITERIFEKKGFSGLAAKICSSLSGMKIQQFPRYMHEVITAIRDDLEEHQTISDWQERCQRFCSFLGDMVLIAASPDCSDTNFTSVIDLLISQSLEQWMSMDKVTTNEVDMCLVCLIALLEVIGPVMEHHNIRFGKYDLESIFSTIRENVLSNELARTVKSTLLDLMLLRSAGWPAKEPDTKSDEEVVEVEEDDNINGESVEEEQFVEDWDPYGKIYSMLEKLKLEDLFKKFKENRIRDTLLIANKDEFKKTLQEAGFPPGVILEIQMFLEKGEELPSKKRNSNSSSKAHNHSLKDTNHHAEPTNQHPRVHSHKSPDFHDQSRDQSREQSREQSHDHQRHPHDHQVSGQSHDDRYHAPDQSHDQVRHQKRDQASNDQVNHEALRRNHMLEQLRQSREQAEENLHQQKIYELEQYLKEPENKIDERESSEQKRFRRDSDETKTRDAHNFFEPSYLSRPPPPRVETTTSHEYEFDQESPQDGPMSYSAVLKAKNEEATNPESVNRSKAVKLTALTKSTHNDNSPPQNRQQAIKTTSREPSKETNRREPTTARPPPGLPPLPPKNWGQSPEINLTVLPSAKRGKAEEPSMSVPPSEQQPLRARQGFGLPPRSSVGRGGASPRGRHEGNHGNQEAHRKPVAWRPVDMDMLKTDRVKEVVQFGSSRKGCITCGSMDHLTCNDRSKLFFD